MSYIAKDGSIHSGQPIECFEIVTSYFTYLHTSCDRTVTVAGKTFTPLAMKRNEVKAGAQSEDNADVQIEIPATCKLAKDCAYFLTPPRMDLTIYRVHEGDDFSLDYVIYWKGVVANFSLEGQIAKIRIPSIFANVLSSAIPTIYYQNPCNHVLFDGGCKVPRADNNVVTTILLAANLSVQIASVGGFPTGYFNGGEIVLSGTGERRMITDHTADVLTISYPFGAVNDGDACEVTAGCDHAYEGDCKLKFDNKINYGGFPFIPSINPFRSGF